MANCSDKAREEPAASSTSTSTNPTILELETGIPKPFALQAAGHQHRHGEAGTGLLELADHSILKPLDSEGRGLREFKFYDAVFDPACKDPILLGLRPLVSQFRGTVPLYRGGKTVTFLKLENLTSGYRYPCVMDVKMGCVTSDPEASPSKIEREREKYKHTKVLGFCIPGMMIYDMKSGKYAAFNKEDGKKLNESTIKAAFLKFLGGVNSLDATLVAEFCCQLQKIRDWFLVQRRWAFYSSSLLFVYDAAPAEQSLQINLSQNDTPCDQRQRRSDVRMIDFAHAFPSSIIDSNYLIGLNNLIGLFEEILRDSSADEG